MIRKPQLLHLFYSVENRSNKEVQKELAKGWNSPLLSLFQAITEAFVEEPQVYRTIAVERVAIVLLGGRIETGSLEKARETSQASPRTSSFLLVHSA